MDHSKLRAKMKKFTLMLFILTVVGLVGCPFANQQIEDPEPSYNVKIAWESDLINNLSIVHVVYNDYVYFYERPPGYNSINIYALTKLDAGTGEFIWRSDEIFSNVVFSQPVVIDGYVYVFLEPNYICCFDDKTGLFTAIVKIDIDNQNLKFNENITSYCQYIYIGLYNNNATYFARFNPENIAHNDSETMQVFYPEILWQPKVRHVVSAKQVFCNDIVYTSTFSPLAEYPVELIGIDINSGDIKFHKSFGGPEDAHLPFPEDGSSVMGNPIIVNGNVLYYLNWSINAWNINTGEQLFRHTFDYSIPESKWYTATNSLQPLYYDGKIYYTTGESYTDMDSYRNTYCISAATGKLVWGAIAKNSESLFTNPIIFNGKLYMSQYSGFRVYDADNGRLLGVDKSFAGASFGRNILYNNYLICVREDRKTAEGRLVAVDLSR